MLMEAEKQGEWAVVWRMARVLGRRAKGKRRRALNVPVMEVPTKAECASNSEHAKCSR